MRKRSKYKPKRPIIPLVFGLSKKDADDLMLVPHQALEMIRIGQGNAQNWHDVAARINYGATWQERFNGAQQPFVDAMAALDSSFTRYKSTGRIILAGDEYKATAYALTLCDEMQQSMTRRELYQDMQTVFKEFSNVSKAH